MAANVSGFFYLSMEVLDNSGASLTTVSAGTGTAFHTVHIQNISTLPRDARVVCVLPNGTRRIEFVVAGTAQDRWDNSTLRIPKSVTRDLACDLRKNTGPASGNEPIQCDEVYEKRGTLPWTRLTAGVPFQMTINVV
jgi:hypothetical protein